MRIALLSFEYPPETAFGGIGTYSWYHARALVKLGHEVHVLAGATEPTALRSEEDDGVHVHRFRADGAWMRVFGGLGRYQLWWTRNRLENALSMLRGLRQLQRELRFDVLEMPECGAEGALLNHRVDVPAVVRFHSPARLIMPTYDVRRADHLLCSIVEQAGIRGADAYTSCSQFLADEVRIRMGVRRSVPVIPNGIDLGLFDSAAPVDARTKFAIPRDRPMIFFSGRMEPRKGIALCREIAASVLRRHAVSFVLAGADLFDYMKERFLPSLQASGLKGSVHYLGKLDAGDVRACLRTADVFLMPSVWENCPYSCLEAMAASRAIVSSDVGGMPELLRHGEDAFVVPSNDAEAFVSAVETLIEDPGARERLGKSARRRIEECYSDVHVAERTLAVYRQAAQLGA